MVSTVRVGVDYHGTLTGESGTGLVKLIKAAKGMKELEICLVTSHVSPLDKELAQLGLAVGDFAVVVQRKSLKESEDSFKVRVFHELNLDLLIDNRAGGLRKKLKKGGMVKVWE